jgi:hypothetical protein
MVAVKIVYEWLFVVQDNLRREWMRENVLVYVLLLYKLLFQKFGLIDFAISRNSN